MTKTPPPLLGFNDNVRYRGRTFHIQTEDSGVKYARVVTHLFVDGGRILKTAKAMYADCITESDLADRVQRLMKEQHRAMFIALRAGMLDGLIDRVEPSVPAPPQSSTTKTKRASNRPRRARHNTGSGTKRGTASVVAEHDDARPTPARASAGTLQSPQAVPGSGLEADAGLPSGSSSAAAVLEPARGPKEGQRGRAPVRMPVKVEGPPEAGNRSIFGGSSIREQSLDEVILSYLDEDLHER